MTKTNKKIQQLAITSVLGAVVVIVSFLPLKTMGLEISFAMVPVAIGAILYGPFVGAILGGIFGIVSFLQCLGYSAFGVLILTESLPLTLIVCIPTRILAGLLTGLIFKWINSTKSKSIKELAFPIASLIAPLLNTIFFMGALVALFFKGDTLQGFAEVLGTFNPFLFIILFVGINGLVEIIAGFVVAYPVTRALSKFANKM